MHLSGEHPSAVVVPVPDAESIVAGWRRLFDGAAVRGMPAHLTALYPFLPPARLTDGVLAQLQEICAAFPVIDVEFKSTSRFPNHLYLEPEPADELVALTQAITAAWPETPPYGGAFDEIVPHITVTQEGQATSEQLGEIEADLLSRLPIRTRLTHACVYLHESGRWRAQTNLPFTARR
jgi:2'-5' RNA ligase